jgi:hypothetical protein
MVSKSIQKSTDIGSFMNQQQLNVSELTNQQIIDLRWQSQGTTEAQPLYPELAARPQGEPSAWMTQTTGKSNFPHCSWGSPLKRTSNLQNGDKLEIKCRFVFSKL